MSGDVMKAIADLTAWKPQYDEEGDLDIGSHESFGAYMADHHEVIMRGLQALRSDASRESAWRPIESAPDDINVLMAVKDDDGEWWIETAQFYSYEGPRTEQYASHFTHWQPLPPPPDMGGDG